MADPRRDSVTEDEPCLRQSEYLDSKDGLPKSSTSCREQLKDIKVLQIPSLHLEGIDPPNNSPCLYQSPDIKHLSNPYDRKANDLSKYSALLPHTMDNQRRVWHHTSFSLSARIHDHFGFSSTSVSRSPSPSPQTPESESQSTEEGKDTKV